MIFIEGVALFGAFGNVGVPFHSTLQFLGYESVYIMVAVGSGALSLYLRMLRARSGTGLSVRYCIGSLEAKVFFVGMAATLAMLGLYSI
jgi:hypothetical protein